MTDYQINIFYSDEDGGYVADVPGLPYCSAFGGTPEEALAQVLKAKALWIETAQVEGRPVPAPSFRPVVLSDAKLPA